MPKGTFLNFNNIIYNFFQFFKKKSLHHSRGQKVSFQKIFWFHLSWQNPSLQHGDCTEAVGTDYIDLLTLWPSTVVILDLIPPAVSSPTETATQVCSPALKSSGSAPNTQGPGSLTQFWIIQTFHTWINAHLPRQSSQKNIYLCPNFREKKKKKKRK